MGLHTLGPHTPGDVRGNRDRRLGFGIRTAPKRPSPTDAPERGADPGPAEGNGSAEGDGSAEGNGSGGMAPREAEVAAP